MIYCKLKGGLGNMMFQVAATLSLAKDKDTSASFPNLDSHLLYLNSEKEYNPNLNYSEEYKNLNIFKFLNVLSPSDKNTNYVLYPFHYENKNIETNSIIEGFFQSEKYFINNKDYILKTFSIDDFIKQQLQDKYSSILNLNTTSMHIRRGDYLKLSNYHPCQTIEYYQKCVDYTKNYTEKYLIFSDDIEWCKTKFLGNRFIFIQEDRDYKELYLMSMCKNNIICNSSFSWWGAWLNQNDKKVVIAPKIWFGSSIKENDSDIIPESWIKI